MTGLQRTCFLLVGALAGLTLGGCGGESGPTGLLVSGKVLDGGQPLVLEDYASGYNYLEVEFVPLDDSGQPRLDVAAASQGVEEDGTFETRVPEAGKYRVALYHMGEGEEEVEDLWEGKFGPDNSPFEFDIAGGEEIEIDISEAEG